MWELRLVWFGNIYFLQCFDSFLGGNRKDPARENSAPVIFIGFLLDDQS